MSQYIAAPLRRGESGLGEFSLNENLIDLKVADTNAVDSTERNAIAEWRRVPYMTCYVIGDDKVYRLGSDVTIAGQVWTEIVYSDPNALIDSDVFDADGYFLPSKMRNLFINDQFVVADEATRLAVTSVSGNVFIQTDDASVWIKLNDDDPSDVSDFAEITSATGAVVSVNGMTGSVLITIANLLADSTNLTDFNAAVASNALVLSHSASIASLTTNKADLVTGTVPLAQLPYVFQSGITRSTNEVTLGGNLLYDTTIGVDTFNMVIDASTAGNFGIDFGSDADQDLIIRNSSGYLDRLAKGADGLFLKMNGGLLTWGASSGGGGGSSTFIGLSDVPGTYVGQSLKTLRVKADETGLEFATGSGGNPFADNSALIMNSSDNTKMAIFSAASISAATTRTYTLPDVNDTLVTLAATQSLTNKKLGSLTSNGFVKTSGGDGTLSVDTTTYLPISGGTLTGALTLNADPTVALHAATKQYVDGLVVGLWDDRGNFNASVNAYPSSGGSGTAGAILKGDIWTISVAGTLPTGQVVEAGDTVRALVDTPGNTQANWAIAQNNIGYTPLSNTLTSAFIFVGNSSNIATGVAMTGDIAITNAGSTSYSGVVPVAKGGTNISSYAVGDLIYASGSTTLSKLADVAVGSYLRSGGVTTAPLWSTTTLPNSAATGDLMYASGTNTYSNLADIATGNVLLSGGVTTAPSYGKVTSAHIDATVQTAGLAYLLATGATLTGNNTIAAGSFGYIFTSGVTTGTGTTAGQQQVFNSLTTGNGVDTSSSSLTTGFLGKYTSTSTAHNYVAGTSGILGISSTGANANSSRTTVGVSSVITNTGTSSTNIAGYFSASGATTNYAIQAVGDVTLSSTAPSLTTFTSTFTTTANTQFARRHTSTLTMRGTASDTLTDNQFATTVTLAAATQNPVGLDYTMNYVQTGGVSTVTSNQTSTLLGMTATTYTSIAPASTSGSGTGALFTVVVSNATTISSVTQTTAGSGYKVNETVTFNGSQFGSGSGSSIYTVSAVTGGASLGTTATAMRLGINGANFAGSPKILDFTYQGSTIGSIGLLAAGVAMAVYDNVGLNFSVSNTLGTQFSKAVTASSTFASNGAATFTSTLSSSFAPTTTSPITTTGTYNAFVNTSAYLASNPVGGFLNSSLVQSKYKSASSIVSSGVGIVVTVSLTNGGTGYTTGTKSTTGGTGTGATISVTTVSATVITVINTSPIAKGSGYSVGDVLTLSGGTGGTVTVTAVDFAGSVVSLEDANTITDASSNNKYIGFLSKPTYNITSAQVGTIAALYHDPTLTATGSFNNYGVIIVPTAAKSGFGTASPLSTVDVSGSLGRAVTLSTGNLTLDGTHSTIVITSGTGTYTLPSASTVSRRIYTIVNQTGTARTISTYLNKSGASATTIAANSSLTVQSDGTSWYALDNTAGTGITNSAPTTELMLSDGTNAVASGLLVVPNTSLTVKASVGVAFSILGSPNSAGNAGPLYIYSGSSSAFGGSPGDMNIGTGTPGSTGAEGALYIQPRSASLISFFGVAAVVKQTALTSPLTTVTFTSPGSPDYAFATVQLAGYGFSTQDEGNTLLSVIANLQARINGLETKLQAYGLLT